MKEFFYQKASFFQYFRIINNVLIKKYKIIIFLSLIINCLSDNFAQNVDCVTATTICDDPNPTGNPTGNGIDDFADPDNDPGCLQNESVNSSWYYFEMDVNTPPNSILGFIITPTGGAGEDYDWALYGPGVGCGNLGSPIRCSSSSEFCGFCPQTGMGMGATDFSEGPGSGDGFVSTMTVNAGDGFFLNINNWKGTGNGFNLDFTGSAAEFIDCAASPPCAIDAIANSNLIKCQGDDPFTIGVAVSGGMPPFTYSWSGSGNGTSYLDNTDIKDPTVTLPSDFTGTITYTVTVTDGFCEDIDDILVTVNPKPVVTINPIAPLCSNGNAVKLVGSPANGTWSGIASSNGTITPSQLPAGIYQATLSYTNNFGCKNQASIDIEIVDPLEIMIDPIDPLCVYELPFQLMPIPSGGTWSGNIDPDGTFDPGKYGPGSHTILYNVVSNEGCKSEEVIVIDVFDIPDIEIEDPGPLCSDESTVSISYTPFGGIWTGPIDALGNVYPDQLGAGTYKIKYSYTSPEGCSSSDSLQIIINDPPKATLNSPVTICNSTLSGQTTLLDFDQLIITGDVNGLWDDVNNSGATGAFPNLNFNGVVPGSYTFTYTTQSANGTCKEFSGIVEVIVMDCNCPSVAISSPGTFCIDNANFDLNQYKITTEVGTWSISNTPPGSNPATILGTNFNGTGKDAGMYTLKFTLSNNPGMNCPDNATNTVTLVTPPIAVLMNSINVCNQIGTGTYPVIIDLNSLILSGDNMGSWVDKNNSGAIGPFNALSFAGVSAGQYFFEYTTNSAMAPCSENTYVVAINVSDCNCPVISLIQPPNICSDFGNIDLQSLQGNSEPGQWSISTKPAGINPATIFNNNFSTSGNDPGTYTLKYTLLNPVNGCPDFKEIQIQVIAPPSAQVTPISQICNSSGSGSFITEIDFSTLITSGDKTGTWSDSDNSGATGGFPLIDFTNVIPGNYIFTYTTSSAILPCLEVSYPITIIVKNCECPDISLVPSMVICNDVEMLDLNSLLLTSEPGTWSISSSPAGSKPLIINGNNITILGADPGIYTLKYGLSVTPAPSCPAFNETTLTINKAPVSGIAAPITNICKGTDQLLKLNTLISGADAGGFWSIGAGSIDPFGAFDQFSAILSTKDLSSGEYIFKYTVNGTAPCKDQSTEISIIINELPFLVAGANQVIDCNKTAAILDPLINLSNVNIEWSGPDISAPNEKQQTVKKPGTYFITVFDNLTGCSTKDSVLVIQSGNPITDVEFIVTNSSCKDVNNGKLEIVNILGGSPDYSIILNGLPINNFNLIENLKPGPYSTLVKDINGCQFNFDFTILTESEIQASLGPDLFLLQGDAYDIKLNSSIAESKIKNITWTPPVCNACFTFSEIANDDIVYEVLIEDFNGCKASDKVNIYVKAVRKVYIPNIFSPDGDGINDIFYIQSDGGVAKIKSFRIYDRWGELLFETFNIQPNDPKAGWNGKFKNKKLDNGVLVYIAEIEFTDGETELYKGDLTIHR